MGLAKTYVPPIKIVCPQEIEQLEGDRLRHCMDMPSEGHSNYIAKASADADAWLVGVRKREDRNATGLAYANLR